MSVKSAVHFMIECCSSYIYHGLAVHFMSVKSAVHFMIERCSSYIYHGLAVHFMSVKLAVRLGADKMGQPARSPVDLNLGENNSPFFLKV
jgi:hypothetical protein